MFSTMPRMGTLSFLNINNAFVAMLSDASCGVVTITTPPRGTVWAKVREESPVPGGRSVIR